MKHVHSFESFINEASAKVAQNFFNKSKGWGLPEGFTYASTISYSGGNLDILIVPNELPDVKQIGSMVTIIDAGNIRNPRSIKPFTYTDRDSLIDLISGIKEVVKLIPSAWKEFENLPQTSKDGAAANLEKLAPAKTLVVNMIGTPKGGRPKPSYELVGKRYVIIPAEDNGDQAAVNDEIKKAFPGAYDIGYTKDGRKTEDLLISFKANI